MTEDKNQLLIPIPIKREKEEYEIDYSNNKYKKLIETETKEAGDE